MMERAREDMKQRGMKDTDKMQLSRELFQPLAERRVRLGLILSALVNQNQLQATQEQIKAHIDELASSYERPEDVARWYLNDARRMTEIEALVTENNVTNFVLEKAKTVEKKVAFDELMSQQG